MHSRDTSDRGEALGECVDVFGKQAWRWSSFFPHGLRAHIGGASEPGHP
jgi:hypothetical protein